MLLALNMQGCCALHLGGVGNEADAFNANAFSSLDGLASSCVTTFAQAAVSAATSTVESGASVEHVQQIHPVQHMHTAEVVEPHAAQEVDAEQVALQEVDSDEMSVDPLEERCAVGEKRLSPPTSGTNTTPATKTMKSTHIEWHVARPRHTGMAFLIILKLIFHLSLCSANSAIC